MENRTTVRFRVYGIVQGVGFRPTVDRHAKTAGICGSVCNKGPYVEIFARGTQEQIDCFRELLREQPPRRAAILKIDEKKAPDTLSFSGFSIIESEKTSGEIYISPDIAICEECEQEMFDPSNRRYLHPFINCTCCGPRMTILDGLPYDRERTSMKMFPMCRTCAEEYHGAWSRRYDAQPVCCNECGPEVCLLRTQNQDQNHDQGRDRDRVHGRAAITQARRTILEGGIVAVKGIGGFHLCCDATDESAVSKLRSRKRRPAKPFAVMMREERTVRRECLLEEAQRQILTGHQKPILLLERSGSPDAALAPSVAPGNPRVGVMLPYAPLHHLLFSYDDGLKMPDCLVMTSGNVSGAPICRDDADALSELSGFCDCILSHDRLIRIRADDSVMDFHRGEPYMIRRSRGYAPLPVLLSEDCDDCDGAEEEEREEGEGLRDEPDSGKKTCVLAVGGELKNSFCIASGNLLYLSPYVGDLEDLRTVRALEETIGRMETLLEVSPQAVVCDLHPKYNATSVAEKIALSRGIPIYRIQHHYAHILSCMAENDFSRPVIGVSFDGTGYGEDGTIWGGEILTADYHGFQRVYSIAPFVQTGGDSAPRQGWRIAASMIWSLCRSGTLRAEPSANPAEKSSAKPTEKSSAKPEELYFSLVDTLALCDDRNAKAQRMMAERGIQAVRSTSAGRLFDAVSAMLGICRESTYEGEASIELQFAAERYLRKKKKTAESPEQIEFSRQNGDSETQPRHLPTDRLFADLLQRHLAGEDPEKLAYEFHAALAGFIVEACEQISAETGIRTAALSGGCFQNRLLLTLTEDSLHEKGLEVLLHHLIPPNDGGIALGQAAAAVMRIRNGHAGRNNEEN